jgi:enterochelin esterase family protein
MKTPLTNPIISGTTVTFLWQGDVAPHFISDLHGWEDNPMPLTEHSPGRWGITFDLAENAYLEYAFYDPQTKERFPDPLNKKSVYNGVGNYNHYFYMSVFNPTPFTRTPGGLRGTVTRHKINSEFVSSTKERPLILYQPPTEAPVPLLVVYDGPDYFTRGKLVEIVDNLIAEGRIRPLALAMVQNGGPARTVEYGGSDATLAFLMGGVIPFAAERIPLLDFNQSPGCYGIMGASMGGIMAVYTALRLPQVFGHALSQAGAFHLWQTETVAVQLARHIPVQPVKLWLDCGQMDFLLDSNRAMADVLREKGYDFVYRENGGAHNYTTWRNACIEGLEWLFK